jgi:hypothetical protein
MSGPMFTADEWRLDALIDEIAMHDTTLGASFAHLTGLIRNDEQLAGVIGLAEIYINSVNMEAILND